MPPATLQWPRGDEPGVHSVSLEQQSGSLLIGRSDQAAVCLARDGSVSRVHAELSLVQGAWLIEDVGSLSHTYLLREGRSQRVEGRVRLLHGDRIRVGRTILRFQDPPTARDEIATVRVDGDTIALTPREQDVLDALCAGELSGGGGWPNDAQLAEQLFISENTVKTHMKSLFAKFRLGAEPGSQKRARLVRRAIDEGWVRPADLG